MSSKSKWKGKIFQTEEHVAEKAQRKQAMEQDVLDFLKPSTEKGSPKAPRIDVAAAQRWPAAASLLSKANTSQNHLSSSLPSSMRGSDRPSRPRAKTLTVGFLNKEPEIIGEGGDESDTPPIEISRRRVVAARAAKEGRRLDDGELGRSLTVSHKLERPEIKKGHASWGQLSPGLDKRFSRPKSPPPQAPPESEADDDAAKLQHRSQDSISQPLDEPDFRPGPLKRTQTGMSEMMPESPEDPDLPRLPELEKVASADSYTNLHDELQNYLSSEPDVAESLSARVQHQMRVDEGQALRRGSVHQVEPPAEDARLASGSSSSTLEMGSPQSMSSNSHGRPSYDQGGHLAKAPRLPNPFDDPTGRRPSSSSSTALNSPSASNTSPIVPVSSSQRDFGPSPFSSSPSTQQSGLAPRPPPHGYFDSTVPTPTQRDFDSSVKHTPEPFVLGEELPDMKSPALNVEIPKQPPRAQQLMERTPWSTTSSGHRSDLVAAGDAAFDDFGERVAHMKGVFRLTAEVKKPMTQYTPLQWIRAASWWFLRGRAGLEVMIRNRPRGQPLNQEEQLLTQAHVDLAKAWWILTEVIDTHPGVRAYGSTPSKAEAARAAGDADMGDVFENQEAALSSLKGLLVSVARNGVMPPTNALIQGQDQSIWVDYPTVSPDAETVLSGQSRSIVMDSSKRQINPRTVMPLSDTKEDFCYGRIFAQVGVMIEDQGDDKISVPCVLTIMRQLNSWQVKVGICSQTELLTVCIQSDPKKGITWDNVKWKTRERGLFVRLPRGFTLSADLNEKDYRMLWGIWDYTRTVEASLKPRHDEELIHDVTLRDLQYKDPENAAAFPPDRVKHSMVRVFEKFLTLNEGTGERKLHRGYRLLMVTSPRNKTLNSVSHEFNGTRPLVFEFRADPADQNVPLMILRIKEDKRKTCTASLAFHEIKERVQLFQVLNGLRVGRDEVCAAQVPMTAFNIEQLGMKEVYSQGHDIVKKLQWQDVKVMDGEPEEDETEQFKILSEQLRIITRHTCGSITDRLNLGPGELLIRLDNSGGPHVHMLRLPQDDANAAIDCKRSEPNVPEAVADFLRTLKTSATIRSYSFPNHEALHKFQLAVTGFQVKYDGVASTLAISRRRMVVPIYKRWEACTVRIQIIQQANVTQLLAFMEDFSHADAMNFQLKSMDVFEIVELKGSKGERGRFGLRLVDAKFHLPRERKKDEMPLSDVDAAKRRFACLDMPEYPGEHDDITLGFETDAERERFASALPAATQLARLISFKRKI
ncbi:hypothetical protein IWX90DRAFT_206455 [Phyllosticta citrichinensis]|uniref:Uncharacterized protein n=1 Tax=Phyllosticta citrichinensis TaxID=1130410 RepID=A0ABR1XSH0_9PEZI